jgi:hypothetical protein
LILIGSVRGTVTLQNQRDESKTLPLLSSCSYGTLLAVAEMGTNRIVIHRTRSIRVSPRDAEKAADLLERNRRSSISVCMVAPGLNGTHNEFYLTQLRTAWTHRIDRVGTELDRLRSLDRRGPVFYWRKVAASSCYGAQGLSRLPDKIGRRPPKEVSARFRPRPRIIAT